MKPLEIEFQQEKTSPEVAILHFDGDLDSNSIEKIGRIFKTVLENNHIFVMAEMSKVSVISSVAIGELMGCRTQMVERGGDLVLVALSLPLREKLNAMDADKIFRFYPDIHSALNAYKWIYHNHAESISLSFPSRLRFVPPVRQLVSRIARQKGYSNRDSFRIETIVDEICNNAVEHGLKDEDNNVNLAVSINQKKIEIKVVNKSDPEKVKSLKEISKSLFSPQAVQEHKRGRGLTLVKMLTNDFDISYSDKGTSVHVTKIREE